MTHFRDASAQFRGGGPSRSNTFSRQGGYRSSQPPLSSSGHQFTIKHLAEIVKLDHPYALPIDLSESKPRVHKIRYILTSHEEQKSRSLDPSSPHVRSRTTSTPSKLENLLKRGSSVSPVPFSSQSHQPRSSTPTGLRPKEDEDEFIDVLSVPLPRPSPIDSIKAKNLMNECLRHVNFARTNDVSGNWEEQIVKTGWTETQLYLFDRVLDVLHEEHLSRLVYKDNPCEPILRRSSLDKTAAKIRTILSDFNWDTKLTQWLHGVLIENLGLDYLASYLDVLQTLRAKIPSLVDKMIVLSTVAALTASSETESGETMKKVVNAEALSLLLKRQWDPFASSLTTSKGKKLPTNPVFLILPCGPPWGSPLNAKRLKLFTSLLAYHGKVICVSISNVVTAQLTIAQYSEKMMSTSKAKLNEVKSSYLNRPIILVGWGPGSITATKMSLTEEVAGVIALGFPFHTLAGPRGEPGDPLLEIKVPTLFIIGERSTNSNLTCMDQYRRSLPCESGLVVVGSGDNGLRISREHRKRLLVTQSWVDKLLVDEIVVFVESLSEKTAEAAEGKTKTKAPKKKSSKALAAERLKQRQVDDELKYRSLLASSLHNGVSSGAVGPMRPYEQSPSSSPSKISNGPVSRSVSMSPVEDMDYDRPKAIPSNVSSSKRKAYFRPPTYTPTKDLEKSPQTITASQLVQQSPGGVRRLSKPSGPPSFSSLSGSQVQQGSSPLGSPAPKNDSESSPSQTVIHYISANAQQQMVALRNMAGDNSRTKFVYASPFTTEAPRTSISNTVFVNNGVRQYIPRPGSSMVKPQSTISGNTNEEPPAKKSKLKFVTWAGQNLNGPKVSSAAGSPGSPIPPSTYSSCLLSSSTATTSMTPALIAVSTSGQTAGSNIQSTLPIGSSSPITPSPIPPQPPVSTGSSELMKQFTSLLPQYRPPLTPTVTTTPTLTTTATQIYRRLVRPSLPSQPSPPMPSSAQAPSTPSFPSPQVTSLERPPERPPERPLPTRVTEDLLSVENVENGDNTLKEIISLDITREKEASKKIEENSRLNDAKILVSMKDAKILSSPSVVLLDVVRENGKSSTPSTGTLTTSDKATIEKKISDLSTKIIRKTPDKSDLPVEVSLDDKNESKGKKVESSVKNNNVKKLSETNLKKVENKKVSDVPSSPSAPRRTRNATRNEK